MNPINDRRDSYMASALEGALVGAVIGACGACAPWVVIAAGERDGLIKGVSQLFDPRIVVLALPGAVVGGVVGATYNVARRYFSHPQPQHAHLD